MVSLYPVAKPFTVFRVRFDRKHADFSGQTSRGSKRVDPPVGPCVNEDIVREQMQVKEPTQPTFVALLSDLAIEKMCRSQIVHYERIGELHREARMPIYIEGRGWKFNFDRAAGMPAEVDSFLRGEHPK